jgi:hypothetical protein
LSLVIYEEYRRFKLNFPLFDNMTLRWALNKKSVATTEIPPNIIMFVARGFFFIFRSVSSFCVYATCLV